mmetsp:Transcript_14837/g.28719  ORF Transcript_14837/g.28719 Transcript_14837/m.28719 type:complete len:183 (-) Transcript_14837:754-1302(-)
MTSRLRQPHIVRELQDGKVSPQGSPQQLGGGGVSPNARLTPLHGGLSRPASIPESGGGLIAQLSGGGRLARGFKFLTWGMALTTAGGVAFMSQPDHALIGTDNCFSRVHKWALVRRDRFFGIETPAEILANPSANLDGPLPTGKDKRSYEAAARDFEIARLKAMLAREDEAVQAIAAQRQEQ